MPRKGARHEGRQCTERGGGKAPSKHAWKRGHSCGGAHHPFLHTRRHVGLAILVAPPAVHVAGALFDPAGVPVPS